MLNQLKKLDMEVDNLYEKINYLKAKQSKITPAYKDICVSGSGITDKFAELTCEIELVREEAEKKWDELIELRKRIESEFNLIDDDMCRQLLILRYLYSYTWRDIANDLKLNSISYVRGDLHRKSLRKYAKVTRNHRKSTF